MDRETRSRIFESAKAELVRHKWDMFEDDPPSAAAGGSVCRIAASTGSGLSKFENAENPRYPSIIKPNQKIAKSAASSVKSAATPCFCQ
jgi:hypothetical protein